MARELPLLHVLARSDGWPIERPSEALDAICKLVRTRSSRGQAPELSPADPAFRAPERPLRRSGLTRPVALLLRRNTGRPRILAAPVPRPVELAPTGSAAVGLD